MAQQEVARDFFIYGLNFTALAAASAMPQTGNIPISADSDFVLQKIAFRADVAAAGQTQSTRVIPLITLLITDTGSGRQISNQAIDLSTFFGTGESPFILNQPKLFRANTLISVVATNYDAVQVYNLKLSFIGYKSFKG